MSIDKINKRRKNLNSIGLAILLCANPLSWLFPTDNIILLYATISLIIVILNNPITIFINNKLWIIIGVLFLFLCSFLFANINQELFFLYFFSFIAFGITGILYSSTSIDYKSLFKSIFIIAFISMPGVYRISISDYSDAGDMSGFWMGVSQGAVRLIIGATLAFSIFKTKINKLIVLPVLIIYLFFLLGLGTRGAVLALLVFIALYYLNKKNKLTKANLFIFFLALLFLNIFFIDISRVLLSVLVSFNIEFKALDKMVYMYDLGLDVSNGRTALWKQAIGGFIESPLYGNGISSYHFKFGQYPHNFFLEILYEGGVLYGIPILYVLYTFAKLIISDRLTIEQKNTLLFLFCAGILEVSLSSVYWRNVFFWFFISYVLTLSSSLKNKTINEKQY